MALITSFERKPDQDGERHKTDVVAQYKVFPPNGQKRILQIDTYGSLDREMPGKLSQTFQLSEESAKALWLILSAEFGFKS
jgi:hypothetical protein